MAEGARPGSLLFFTGCSPLGRDFVSVPQRSPVEQKSAILSLWFVMLGQCSNLDRFNLRFLLLRSYYAQQCTRFIPLIRDADAWLALYQEDISNPECPTAGTLQTFISRGWCRLEIAAGLAPKRFASGSWRPGAGLLGPVRGAHKSNDRSILFRATQLALSIPSGPVIVGRGPIDLVSFHPGPARRSIYSGCGQRGYQAHPREDCEPLCRIRCIRKRRVVR